jgi:hypothetical protein
VGNSDCDENAGGVCSDGLLHRLYADAQELALSGRSVLNPVNRPRRIGNLAVGYCAGKSNSTPQIGWGHTEARPRCKQYVMQPIYALIVGTNKAQKAV